MLVDAIVNNSTDILVNLQNISLKINHFNSQKICLKLTFSVHAFTQKLPSFNRPHTTNPSVAIKYGRRSN